MNDLDPVLRPWISSPPDWSESRAEQLVRDLGFTPDYEPPDEEWIMIGSQGWEGMVSTRYPLAIVVEGIQLPSGVAVVHVVAHDSEDLRASRDVLEATVLHRGITDPQFDSNAFCAWDLAVEGV